ncbi:MAG: restriction endonuclease, partial [Gammaproteobacteria bacterium]|nr:restriction endonuclease [Gammaproteobacteria bacterium]
MKSDLTIDLLKATAAEFARSESVHDEPTMFGVTDGKAVGTYLEHKFRTFLRESYSFNAGSSAKGIDLPGL